MEKRELTCNGCPLGCTITVEIEYGMIKNITGNTCMRGADYARNEIVNPLRIVTSSVPVTGGHLRMVSVKTRTAIPKELIFDCIRELKGITVTAPVHIGDIIIENVAGTGVDIIATKEI